ncbi:hypothetical protein BAY59_24390 [Prauserella coralliicola]|nr:hypothetical protein BAY59_24390 [Prauserella coralliicola]
MEEPTWMGTAGVSRYAGVHAKSVEKAARKGSLRGYQNGANGTWRFHRDDVDDWMRRGAPIPRKVSAA